MDRNRIIEIIAEEMNTDAGKLTAETKLAEDLGADSLDVFQIIMALEDEYKIEIPTADAEGIQTIGDVVEYLTKRFS